MKSYVESGIAIDAALPYDLLVTVFNPQVPLHDGAVIIQNNRVAAASMLAAVDGEAPVEQGTRHTAGKGIGVTEETDAVAIIVSEGTGAIS